MESEKLLRDPIHDLIVFDRRRAEDRVLLSALDTAEVQRLRRIKQLGMAHMAYQGAEHSRFSHSVGVTHLIRRMLGRLERDLPPRDQLDEITRVALVCAGLVHDLGHGPFSHVMEKFFREDHEVWSERIILSEETEIHTVLSKYDARLPGLVVDVLGGNIKPKWASYVVSSQMDADRFDYLLRDSHMTGVKYGVFDLERLLLLLRVSDDGERVVLSSKALMPVEKYLQSRYQMYRQVYFHKTVTSAEAMLMAVLDRARDLAKEGNLPGVVPSSPLAMLMRNERLGIPDFLALDDSILLAAMNGWTRCEDATLRDLSTRLLTRRLFKSLELEGGGDGDDLLFDERINAAREFLEDHGLDFRYYLRFSKSSDTPYKPYSPRSTSSTIWIQDPHDPSILSDVKEVSPTIRAFTESKYSIHRAFFPAAVNGVDIRKEMTAILRG